MAVIPCVHRLCHLVLQRWYYSDQVARNMREFMFALISIHCLIQSWTSGVEQKVCIKMALLHVKKANLYTINIQENTRSLSRKWEDKTDRTESPSIQSSTTCPPTKTWLKSWINTFTLDHITFSMCSCCHVQLLYRHYDKELYVSLDRLFLLHEVYQVSVFALNAIILNLVKKCVLRPVVLKLLQVKQKFTKFYVDVLSIWTLM